MYAVLHRAPQARFIPSWVHRNHSGGLFLASISLSAKCIVIRSEDCCETEAHRSILRGKFHTRNAQTVERPLPYNPNRGTWSLLDRDSSQAENTWDNTIWGASKAGAVSWIVHASFAGVGREGNVYKRGCELTHKTHVLRRKVSLL